MLCSEAVKVNRNHTGGQVVLLKCKRWSCPLCHGDNRWRVIRAGRRGKPDKFVTLTCSSSQWETPDAAARAMVASFKTLIRRIREKYPTKPVEYLRVFEKTKKGWPHLHVLMRAPWIDQAWWSATWHEIYGAFIVDVRAVDNLQKALFYVTKYIGKELGKFEGVTRWFKSRGWCEPEERDTPSFYYGDAWTQLNLPAHLALWRFHIEAKRRGDIIEERTRKYVRWSALLRKDSS